LDDRIGHAAGADADERLGDVRLVPVVVEPAIAFGI
jgi:hypothetical protein